MTKSIGLAAMPQDSRFIGLDDLAARWSVSRSTARRVVERSGISAFFLTGAKKGVRRYRMVDVTRLEERVEAKNK